MATYKVSKSALQIRDEEVRRLYLLNKAGIDSKLSPKCYNANGRTETLQPTQTARS